MKQLKQRKSKPETSSHLTRAFLRYSGAVYIAEVQAALRAFAYSAVKLEDVVISLKKSGSA
jgi:hypothetical protein